MWRMIVGIVLCLVAGVWIAQGLGWLGGSGMSCLLYTSDAADE